MWEEQVVRESRRMPAFEIKTKVEKKIETNPFEQCCLKTNNGKQCWKSDIYKTLDSECQIMCDNHLTAIMRDTFNSIKERKEAFIFRMGDLVEFRIKYLKSYDPTIEILIPIDYEQFMEEIEGRGDKRLNMKKLMDSIIDEPQTNIIQLWRLHAKNDHWSREDFFWHVSHGFDDGREGMTFSVAFRKTDTPFVKNSLDYFRELIQLVPEVAIPFEHSIETHPIALQCTEK